MRAEWTAAKKDCLTKVKKADPEGAKELDKLFNQGLGPQVDKYEKELDKFPDVDLTKLMKHVTKIKSIIDQYEKGIEKGGGLDGVALNMILDSFMDIIQADVKWYTKYISEIDKKS